MIWTGHVVYVTAMEYSSFYSEHLNERGRPRRRYENKYNIKIDLREIN
jgi:hypothetical protein